MWGMSERNCPRSVYGSPCFDYKSLSVAIKICATMVNTHIHTKREGEERETDFDRERHAAKLENGCIVLVS